MLSQGVIDSTRAVLEKMMTYRELSQYFLIGGTALAIRNGNRLSEDIDLFFYNPYPGKRAMLPKIDLILARLKMDFGEAKYIHVERGYEYKLIVDGVKVDFMSEPNFHRCKNYSDLGYIKLPDEKCLLGMKIIALHLRGATRDIYDLFTLKKTYSEVDFYEAYSSIMSSVYIGSKSPEKKYKLFERTIAKLYDMDWLNEHFLTDELSGLSIKHEISIDLVRAQFSQFKFSEITRW